MQRSPRVSVITTAYNVEAWTKEAIDSILNQSMTDFEFIIINDGSSDETGTLIRSFKDDRIRYIHCSENKGISYRANQGLMISNAEYVARFDADDVSHPNRLSLQLAAFEKEADLAVCTSWCDARTEDGFDHAMHYQPAERPEDIFLSFLTGVNPLIQSATMLKKRAVLAAGGYSEALDVNEDFDLLLRMALQGSVMRIVHHSLVNVRMRELSHRQKNEKAVKEACNKIVNAFYSRLGCEVPLQAVLMRTFFESADTFITLLDQKTWQTFIETVQTIYHSIVNAYGNRQEFADRFIDEVVHRLNQVQPKLKSLARRKDQLRDREFARRVPPAQKIKIEEAFAVHDLLRATNIRDVINNNEDVKYV